MAQSFVFATLVCQRNCVFLCKGTKLKIVMPVFCGTELRFCGTELWGPKPVIPDQRFCRWKLLFYQQPCAKAKEFGEKQGKLYFLQSSQTKGRDVLASKKPSLVQLPCAKTREFGEAEFSDCLPVSALVCVFAFDTGGQGLWLGAFGRSRLYRCQSTPGPPMPCLPYLKSAF